MIARMLVPAAAANDSGAMARLERLERRVGVEAGATPRPTAAAAPAAPRQATPVVSPVATPEVAPPSRIAPPSPAEPRIAAPAHQIEAPSLAAQQVAPPSPAGQPMPAAAEVRQSPQAATAGSATVTIQHVRDAWPEILETVQRAKRSAWAVVYTSHPRALDGDVLTLSFVSRSDVESFRQTAVSGGVSEVLRSAILEVLGVRVKFLPKVDGGSPAPEPQQHEQPTPEPAGWGEPAEAAPAAAVHRPPSPVVAPVAEQQRYGEAVVREILGASFLEETVVPREVG
jgi:DNA polymerase-3 subunit gamma/tau